MELRGFLSQEALASLYSAAHLFLHPSEMPPDQNQEGVPNSMLEAMSTGLPVLATLHGGIPEAVTHGVSGLLVPERDDAGLTHGLLRLASQPALYAGFSEAAAQSVRAEFEQEAAIARLESFYDEARDRFPETRAALHEN